MIYPDGRPSAVLRMEAKDQGVVLKDGAGPKGWLACLAMSTDLMHWSKKGPVLDFGKPGEDDSASASYGVTFFDGPKWHMFYPGTRMCLQRRISSRRFRIRR